MRIAIIGCGNMGSKRRDILLALGETDLLAYDPDYERSFNFGIRPDIRICPDTDVLWTKQPEAVFICTPPEMHLKLAYQAWEHGAKGIFVEKPLDLAMPPSLLGAAWWDRCVTMVGCNWRFRRGVQGARERTLSGELGELALVVFRAQYSLPDVRSDYKSMYAATTGAILDVGWHMVDLALDWFGPAHLHKVKASSAESIGLPDIDGRAVLVLEHIAGHSPGFYSNVSVSIIDRQRDVSLDMNGSCGTLSWTAEAENLDEEPSMFVAETQHFLDCVREGKQTCNPVDRAMETLGILLEAKRRWLGNHPSQS